MQNPMSPRPGASAWKSIRGDLVKAAESLGLKKEDFQPVSPHRYEPILKAIIDKFTTLGYHQGRWACWLWGHYKGETRGFCPEDTLEVLSRALFPGELVWFVAEDSGADDLGTKKSGNFWLFEGRTEAVPAVLGEMHFFEFYIVSRKLEWLVGQNHHGYMSIVGQPMIDRFRDLGLISE